MEIPSPDQQTTLYGLLTFIGGGLMAIARGLYKLLRHFLETAKKEGEDRGKLIAKIDNLEMDLKELKTDIDAIALFVETPRAIATKQAQKDKASD